MKFFQKRWVAWTLCVLLVFASTLLNTRWKLGARCSELAGSFYGEGSIAQSLSQLGEDGLSLAKLAEANGIDAGALHVAAENDLNSLSRRDANAAELYKSYAALRSELDSAERKLLGTSLGTEDASALSACLESIHTANARIDASDYNAQVRRFLYRYDNGFTRMLANLAGVDLPAAFA